MTSLPRHKKIWQTLLILACAGALWAIPPYAVYAAGGLKTFADIVATVTMVYGILYLLQGFLVIVLGIVGGWLSFAFALNTSINPGQLIIVQQGWLILRDLANGIFILLLLWIAITIIFQLDQLGGKRFLVKIIIVALLINFSLALVSTVFALGNVLAVPFAQKMGLYPTDCTATTCTPAKTTIADLIIANSQLHEVTKAITTQGADNIWKAGLPSPTAPQLKDENIITQYFGAPPTAHAIAPLVLAGILLKPLVVAGLTHLAGALATALFAGALHVTGADMAVINAIFNMAIASGFLLLTSLAMLSAAIILLVRVVMMVFLGIFAPIAFLGIAFPKFGDKIWSRWIRELFNWAFTAPIFYFLLYIALLMMQTNRSGNEALFASMSFTANFFKMLNLVLFLVFLWAAVYMTRKTAGHFADVALNLGRKAAGFGLGVATGFAARGVARGALRFAPQVEKTMNAIGRTPLGLALGRRTEKYIQAERERAKKREDQFKGGSEQYLAAQLRSSTSAEDIAAIGRVAANENKMGALKGREEQVVKLSTRLGLQEDILKKLPHFATAKNVPGAKDDADAIEKILKNPTTDKAGINADNLLPGTSRVANAETVLEKLWQNTTTGDLSTIGYKNAKLREAMTGHIESLDPAHLKAFKDSLNPARRAQFDSYFTGALAGDASGGGWRPRNWGVKIATSTIPNGTTGTPYSATVNFEGGVPPYAPTYPTLPTWLTPTLATTAGGGTLSFTGTPPAPGTYDINVEVADGAGGITTKTFKIIVS